MNQQYQNTQNALVTKDDKVKAIQIALETDHLPAINSLMEEGRAKRAVTSLMLTIANSKPNKDGVALYDCTPSSVATALMTAAHLGFEIDGRQHCYPVPYKNKQGQYDMEIQPGYKGYLYKIKQANPTVDVTLGTIFDGDVFEHWSESGNDFYKHKSNRPAAKTKDYNKLLEAFCYMTYTVDGKAKSKLTRMTFDEIKMIRTKAKTQMVWNEFVWEQINKTLLRNACKVPFAMVISELDAIDNRHFDLEQTSTADVTDAKGATHNVSELLKKEKETGEIIEGSFTETKETPESAPADDSRSKDEGAQLPPKSEDRDDPDMPPAAEGWDDPSVQNSGVTQEPQDTGEPWNNKLLLQGKEVAKDFETAEGAYRYLVACIRKRSAKSIRKAMIEENTNLVCQLIREGNVKMVNELHRIADEGRDDESAA